MAQAHVVPFMRQARVPPHGETPYVMTDDSFEGPAAGAEPWKLVWSGEDPHPRRHRGIL